jgi:molybdenum cofactor synthesis domain-containing protein
MTAEATRVIIEILCIGNELLLGTIHNTNAQWISNKITEVGGSVKRITVVGDDVNEISKAVKESLRRKPNWLIISGGLGPTYDDKTLQGVGTALDLKLVLDNTAVEMLKKSYSQRNLTTMTTTTTTTTTNHELNDIRLKMAKIPMGSTPIQNPVGSAPSVLIETASKATKIICLPGVPKEMEATFSESILPQIKKIVGDFYIANSSYEITGVSEAMLAPALSNIVDSHPANSIYVKTHPLGYTSDNKPRLRIQIVSKGKDKSEVQMRYNNISNTLAEKINTLGGKIHITTALKF